MPSATSRSALAYRPSPTNSPVPPTTKSLKHRPTSSTDLVSYHVQQPTNTLHRPLKRFMPTPKQTIAVVNSSGRQAASFIRVASAVGYKVRAQLRNLDGIVASEIASLPNVKVFVGDLYIAKKGETAAGSPSLSGETEVNHELIKNLFRGADLAFINTTFWGDEKAIGIACADAAVKADVKHYIYSSMPNHSLCSAPTSSKSNTDKWPSLPLWSSKFAVEQYVRTTPLLERTTFLYTGIYNNNFTSLPYPLFCMELQKDGTFSWTAPFHPEIPLPWLDAEHDVGPAVLQIFKDGISKWGMGKRIALAYEMLTPIEACKAFSRGLGRPVKYRWERKIEVKVGIPRGYRDQLEALEVMYKGKQANEQPPYFGDWEVEKSCPREAMELWEGHRGLEEYAREVFPLEEAANGLTWMNDSDESEQEGRIEDGSEEKKDEEDGDESDDEGLTMGGNTETPARKEEGWLA